MINGLQKLKKITTDRDESIKLLTAALNKESFLEYIFNYFDREELFREISFSKFDINLSELEFQEPHLEYHYPLIWEVLKNENFSSIDATNPIKWLSIALQMVENSTIEPFYFAFIDNSKNGKKNIIEALRYAKQGDNKENNKKLFDISRAILRHMFGSIKERGQKGIYRDIPFAKVWWQMHFAKESEENSKINSTILIKMFTNIKAAYGEYIEEGYKLTIIFDKNIRDGLFLYAIEAKLNAGRIKDMYKKVGIESSCRSLGNLNAQDNKLIIQSLMV